jgi:hypothetical protein
MEGEGGVGSRCTASETGAARRWCLFAAAFTFLAFGSWVSEGLGAGAATGVGAGLGIA